ncbi:hypothetical protein FQA39_LY16239 [Lamprigera yunnana]|nr:hypothetical protein FQA39_LY16239 [Lamprigera yunnana]
MNEKFLQFGVFLFNLSIDEQKWFPILDDIFVRWVDLHDNDVDCCCQLIVSRGGPEVEKPILLNSFLPASMQIIAYLTDLMKYETKVVDDLTTTTTVRPTPFHKPGIYAPQTSNQFASHRANLDKYLYTYYNQYQRHVDLNEQLEKVQVRASNGLPSDIDLLGAGPVNLLKLINTNDEDADVTDEERSRKFSEIYDDVYLRRRFVVGNKKPPPTKAYVTLLSLYDQLNQESKKLQLNKYGGYTNEVLKSLELMSKGTSSEQLYLVLDNLVKRRDSKDPKVYTKGMAGVNGKVSPLIYNPRFFDLKVKEEVSDEVARIPEHVYADDGRLFHPCKFCCFAFAEKSDQSEHMQVCSFREEESAPSPPKARKSFARPSYSKVQTPSPLAVQQKPMKAKHMKKYRTLPAEIDVETIAFVDDLDLSDSDSLPNVCTICGEVLENQISLYYHKRNKHPKVYVPSDSLKNYDCLFRKTDMTKCVICDMDTNQEKWPRHLASHAEEISYECALCNQKFRRKDQYKVHMRSHSTNV